MTGIDETFHFLPITEGRTRNSSVHLWVRSFPGSDFRVSLCGRESTSIETWSNHKAKRCTACVAVAGALGSNMVPLRRV